MSKQSLCAAACRAAFGWTPILHYTCRDRNLLGPVAHLLGRTRSACTNLVVITGDPPKIGDYPGRDPGLRPRLDRPPAHDGPTSTTASTRPASRSGLRPAASSSATGAEPAPDLGQELRAAASKKVRPAPSIIMTQPVYDPQPSRRSSPRSRHLGLPVLVGLLPLVSSHERRVPAQRGAGHAHPRRYPRADAQGGHRERRRRPRGSPSPRRPPSPPASSGTGSTSCRRSTRWTWRCASSKSCAEPSFFDGREPPVLT